MDPGFEQSTLQNDGQDQADSQQNDGQDRADSEKSVSTVPDDIQYLGISSLGGHDFRIVNLDEVRTWQSLVDRLRVYLPGGALPGGALLAIAINGTVYNERSWEVFVNHCGQSHYRQADVMPVSYTLRGPQTYPAETANAVALHAFLGQRRFTFSEYRTIFVDHTDEMLLRRTRISWVDEILSCEGWRLADTMYPLCYFRGILGTPLPTHSAISSRAFFLVLIQRRLGDGRVETGVVNVDLEGYDANEFFRVVLVERTSILFAVALFEKKDVERLGMVLRQDSVVHLCDVVRDGTEFAVVDTQQ